MFADLLMNGGTHKVIVTPALPERTPAPLPLLQNIPVPIGPVAVFGASNFPLAFSTAGGDTASALAAGCTVVFKAHPSHPRTNEIIDDAIQRAAKKTGMPDFVFQSVHLSNTNAVKLVQHPFIKAVGFTGSKKAGMVLFQAAVQREDPIPVFAEMSSVNPLVLLQDSLKSDPVAIAKGLVSSITSSMGQLCTKPGLIFLAKNNESDHFLELFTNEFLKIPQGELLNKGIKENYVHALDTLQVIEGMQMFTLSSGNDHSMSNMVHPAFCIVTADMFLTVKELSSEVFGPAAIFVICNDVTQLLQSINSLEGQLSGTIHATRDDYPIAKEVAKILTKKVGRIVFGGFPTGVEVCDAMQHGGPFPATTDSRFTSVGAASINRFTRPLVLQGFPADFMPEILAG